jgi:aspartyl-tRNA(Asn)/glutamyl-tRNA(Gln) amidotransferase subunit B
MYTPTIGLEVHAELKTKSKMFCGCANDPHASLPNTHICPVCMAHPGSLPVPNKSAIKAVLTFGIAVEGTLATYSEFDRKNYFYPDIPKAYQLSQYAFPFVVGGELAGVKLTRVHLEEDTARSQHDKGQGSLVDFNRAGVPLMELVTEPVIHDAKAAGNFARELQLILRTLAISDANMEKGEMRVEANISVSATEQLGTKVEVKNLNSFKSVESAIAYEIDRQVALLEAGQIVQQETRGWDEAKLETYLQRTKETAKDYRYFPDPDIPKFQLTEVDEFSAKAIQFCVPELPASKRLKYSDLGLPSETIETIIADGYADTYFKELVLLITEPKQLHLAANYLLTDLMPLVRQNPAYPVLGTILTPAHFTELMTLLLEKKITSRIAKDLIIEFAVSDRPLLDVVAERNLSANFSAEDLQTLVHDILAEHPAVVAEYKAGKVASLQFLLGQAMKRTKGTANPVELTAVFEVELLK